MLRVADERNHRAAPVTTTVVITASVVMTFRTIPAAVPLDRPMLDTVLESCEALEISSTSDAPMVAIERNVHITSGTYHLNIRRLNSSVPAGKFQILISRDLASGMIF